MSEQRCKEVVPCLSFVAVLERRQEPCELCAPQLVEACRKANRCTDCGRPNPCKDVKLTTAPVQVLPGQLSLFGGGDA